MPAFDAERLEVANTLRIALAIENELSRPQARAYVRCLQATWQVPTIQWGAQESSGQLADARRLLHAAHIFRQIEGPNSTRAIDCYRRTGEILEWLDACCGQRSIHPPDRTARGGRLSAGWSACYGVRTARTD